MDDGNALTVVYATTGHVKSVASLQKVDMRVPNCFALAAPEIMSPSCAYKPPMRAPIEVPSTYADINIKNLLLFSRHTTNVIYWDPILFHGTNEPLESVRKTILSSAQ
jgi:hypothetical protein